MSVSPLCHPRMRGNDAGASRGFTLVELLVVIVLLTILALVALPKYFSLVQEAKIASTRAGLGAVRSALQVGMAQRVSNNQPPFPAILAADDFATAEIPLNQLNGIRGASAVVSIPGGTATSATNGYWYIQANGLAGAYSDGAVDTSGW